MKIAFIHPVYKGGGAEVVTDTLIMSLRTRGDYDMTIMTLCSGEPFLTAARNRGIDVELLDPAPEFVCDEVTDDVASRLARGGYDVVIMTVEPLHDFGRIRLVAPKCRILFHLHCMPFFEYGRIVESYCRNRNKPWFRLLRERLLHRYRRHLYNRYREVYDAVDGYVVLCEGYRHEMEAIVCANGADSHVVAMYNPLPRAISRPDSGLGRTVLYVGRLSYADKRPDRLLRIWARVAPEYPDWRLKIVGDGSYRADMERMVQDLGIAGSVEFCGYCADPTPYYAEASILCLTSEFEGWGMVLAEGQQAGVWPIAFDVCAGVRELVGKDGTRGTLVRPYSEKAYAGKLKRLMADPARLAALRPSMMASTAKYAPDAVIAAWDRYLSSL